MFHKVRPFTLSIFLTFLLLALTASVVVAAPPQDLHIEALEFIGSSGEPFTASGSAVDSNMVCATGTIDDIEITASGSSSGGFLTLHVLKRFYCDDLSGTFDIRMVVRLDLTTNETTARWRIVDGTGAYAALKGSGSLVGTPVNPGVSILDVYDGRVH
jgi:hypothetical protein